MPIVVAVSRRLENENLSSLTVSLSDERYGPVGHSDSNWAQLLELGFYLPGAMLQPVLEGKSFEQTADDFSSFLEKQLAQADFKLGFIGIGPDSHFAGIKPGSPAIESKAMAVSYKWNDYERITMTFGAIEKLDTVISYLAGESKARAIKELQKDSPVAKIPSQILKKLKQAVIFNDRIGESL